MKTISFPDDCVLLTDSLHKTQGGGCIKLGSHAHLIFTQSGTLLNNNDDSFEHPLPKGHFNAGDERDTSDVKKLAGPTMFYFIDTAANTYRYQLTPKQAKDCDEDDHSHGGSGAGRTLASIFIGFAAVLAAYTVSTYISRER